MKKRNDFEVTFGDLPSYVSDIYENVLEAIEDAVHLDDQKSMSSAIAEVDLLVDVLIHLISEHGYGCYTVGYDDGRDHEKDS